MKCAKTNSLFHTHAAVKMKCSQHLSFKTQVFYPGPALDLYFLDLLYVHPQETSSHSLVKDAESWREFF